ncbi:MAG: alcohol dehydrogenase catalytic domain-containing protein, partial [Dehalococcoidia bacterium]|nr:alcohol dehydrogenase catalytic domain-containing protein [Dehalococcoidia bacterium]
MNALVFRYSLPRLAISRIAGALSPAGYLGPWSSIKLEQIPEPSLPGDDWLLVRTTRCGICGSDAKQVFLKGNRDNPMTALVSFPHVLGHEAAGVIEHVGPAVRERHPGERVVINPWLSCGPRGIDPPCRACRAGDYPLCERFTEGRLAPGIHAGNCADVPGGFAERIAVHESQAIPIPDGIDWDTAVLADPFSVSLHTVLLHPPPSDEGPAIVFGCGTLGLLTIAILRQLHPDVAVLAVARYPHQAELARRLGAQELLPEGKLQLIEAVAREVGTEPLRPWFGDPWLLKGVGVIYDTVGSPASVELALRVAGPRSKIVVSGVEAPRRFEWTPLYFKEVSIVGSNAFGVETFE